MALAYDTGHASGVEGGRFIEMLRVPWLDADQAWDCSLYLGRNPWPASRKLIFTNLTFRTDDPKVREKCGIQKNLGRWIEEGGTKNFVGEQRWFAGYFTTADGGWFFQSEGTSCGEKAYTLTFKAKIPNELPIVGDPGLRRIINEAINIVDSIHYKRCPPATTP